MHGAVALWLSFSLISPFYLCLSHTSLPNSFLCLYQQKQIKLVLQQNMKYIKKEKKLFLLFLFFFCFTVYLFSYVSCPLIPSTIGNSACKDVKTVFNTRTLKADCSFKAGLLLRSLKQLSLSFKFTTFQLVSCAAVTRK